MIVNLFMVTNLYCEPLLVVLLEVCYLTPTLHNQTRCLHNFMVTLKGFDPFESHLCNLKHIICWWAVDKHSFTESYNYMGPHEDGCSKACPEILPQEVGWFCKEKSVTLYCFLKSTANKKDELWRLSLDSEKKYVSVIFSNNVFCVRALMPFIL